jgi:hypothetical protein
VIAYFDTSALLPLLIDEPGSDRAGRLWAEVRVGIGEGGVAFSEHPDGPGQPVRGAGVEGVGQLDGLGARVERPVRLYPQDHVAAVLPHDRLQAGDPTQQLVGPLATVVVAELLPVAHVDDRRTRHVVGVEGAPERRCPSRGRTALRRSAGTPPRRWARRRPTPRRSPALLRAGRCRGGPAAGSHLVVEEIQMVESLPTSRRQWRSSSRLHYCPTRLV